MDLIPIHFNRVSNIPSQQMESFRAIYLDSFPPHERAEFGFLVESIATGTRWFFGATRGDTLLGFAILVPDIARDIHLLEYLAVSRDARNLGIGGKLLDHVANTLRDQSATRGLLLEVETDDEGDADTRALRARRIAFYRRHGARWVDRLPNYRVPIGNAATMRMKLLWLPLNPATDLPDDATLRQCLVEIYTRSYELQRDDPFIRSMLSLLDAQARSQHG